MRYNSGPRIGLPLVLDLFSLTSRLTKQTRSRGALRQWNLWALPRRRRDHRHLRFPGPPGRGSPEGDAAALELLLSEGRAMAESPSVNIPGWPPGMIGYL